MKRENEFVVEIRRENVGSLSNLEMVYIAISRQ